MVFHCAWYSYWKSTKTDHAYKLTWLFVHKSTVLLYPLFYCFSTLFYFDPSAEPRSIDAGIFIQTEVACAPITGTTASVVVWCHWAEQLLLNVLRHLVSSQCVAVVLMSNEAMRQLWKGFVLCTPWCRFSTMWLWWQLWSASVSFSLTACAIINLFTLNRSNEQLHWTILLSFSVLLYFRYEWEKYYECHWTTHTRTLCRDYTRLRGNHISLLLPLVLTTLGHRRSHSQRPPQVTRHAAQTPSRQQQQ